MTTAVKTALGAALWLAPDGITPLVKIAELTSINPPVGERGTIDATTHDSTGQAKEFIVEGTYDPGEIQIEGHYIAGSTNDDALLLALQGGAKQDFKIVAKAASGTEDITGECYVTSYGPGPLDTEGKQTFSATLKVTGPLTQAASA